MGEQSCGTCRYFERTGKESSGIALQPGVQWVYAVGECRHPEPVKGGAMTAFHRIAEWLPDCLQFKPKGNRP